MRKIRVKTAMPPPVAIEPPTHPLRTVALVIYVTLALLAVAIPQSLVNRMRDMNPGAVENALLEGAQVLQRATGATGIAVPYRRARALFLASTGKEP
jgi:hypothetical protein